MAASNRGDLESHLVSLVTNYMRQSDDFTDDPTGFVSRVLNEAHPGQYTVKRLGGGNNYVFEIQSNVGSSAASRPLILSLSRQTLRSFLSTTPAIMGETQRLPCFATIYNQTSSLSQLDAKPQLGAESGVPEVYLASIVEKLNQPLYDSAHDDRAIQNMSKDEMNGRIQLAIHVGNQLYNMLNELSEHKIIWTDLKVENLFLRANRDIAVADMKGFVHANLLEKKDDNRFKFNVSTGMEVSVAYLSPTFYKNAIDVDGGGVKDPMKAWRKEYSFQVAIILHYLLTGQMVRVNQFDELIEPFDFSHPIYSSNDKTAPRLRDIIERLANPDPRMRMSVDGLVALRSIHADEAAYRFEQGAMFNREETHHFSESSDSDAQLREQQNPDVMRKRRMVALISDLMQLNVQSIVNKRRPRLTLRPESENQIQDKVSNLNKSIAELIAICTNHIPEILGQPHSSQRQNDNEIAISPELRKELKNKNSEIHQLISKYYLAGLLPQSILTVMPKLEKKLSPKSKSGLKGSSKSKQQSARVKTPSFMPQDDTTLLRAADKSVQTRPRSSSDPSSSSSDLPWKPDVGSKDSKPVSPKKPAGSTLTARHQEDAFESRPASDSRDMPDTMSMPRSRLPSSAASAPSPGSSDQPTVENSAESSRKSRSRTPKKGSLPREGSILGLFTRGKSKGQLSPVDSSKATSKAALQKAPLQKPPSRSRAATLFDKSSKSKSPQPPRKPQKASLPSSSSDSEFTSSSSDAPPTFPPITRKK